MISILGLKVLKEYLTDVSGAHHLAVYSSAQFLGDSDSSMRNQVVGLSLCCIIVFAENLST